MIAKICSYWEGCNNLATHGYGRDDFCDDHDVRTPEEATIDRLRSEVARITVDRDALRDHAKACAFSLAEELAGEEIGRLRSLLSRARDALYTAISRGDAFFSPGVGLKNRAVVAEIEKELGT